jgi:aspartate racemase
MGGQVKRVGLIGGTSWESTLEYYRLINQRSGAALGGDRTAEILLWSLDFGAVLELKARGDFAQLAVMFRSAARGLAALGAELLVICSNTGHLRAPDTEAAVAVPLVHIVDAVGVAIRRQGLGRVALLGTLETMRSTFYRDRLREAWNVETVVPEPKIQARVHEIAILEVARGRRSNASRAELIQIIGELCPGAAGGVILGCTELPLLVSNEDVEVPLFDSLSLHVDAIVERALG